MDQDPAMRRDRSLRIRVRARRAPDRHRGSRLLLTWNGADARIFINALNILQASQQVIQHASMQMMRT
jgi:hypothetical protein